MFFTDIHFDYVKRFIDRTYEQRKNVLSNQHFSKADIECVKRVTIAYCTGYILALRSFHILSDGAFDTLETYILERGEES